MYTKAQIFHTIMVSKVSFIYDAIITECTGGFESLECMARYPSFAPTSTAEIQMAHHIILLSTIFSENDYKRVKLLQVVFR